MSKRIDIKKTYKMYMGGAFPRSESERYYPLNDKKGNFIANICLGSRKDFRNAVVAARKAFDGWAARSAYNRGQILYRIAEMMEGRKDQLVAELVKEGSSPKAAQKEAETAIDRVVYFAGWTDKYQQVFGNVNPVASSHFNFSNPEPTGVVSVIAPQNESLLGFVQTIIPIIAGGNVVVVQASEMKPLATLTFCEILHSSDVPGGVVNVITGKTKELASHFSSHMDVNAVVFCEDDSSLKKLIQENASLNVKGVVHRQVKDYYSDENENPYLILDLQEIKTTWHPVGI